MKHVLAGRDLSRIVTFSDSVPLAPALNFDNANTGTVSWPDRLSHVKLCNPTINRYFGIDAFVFPERHTFGHSGRNILNGPGANFVKFALSCNFGLPLSKVSEIDFRFKAINLFNRLHFGLPGLSIGKVNAGVIGGSSQDNGQLQFGLKFLF